VPGWDTTTVVHLLDQIKPDVPFIHFGDLDPNGTHIFLKLRQRRPGLRWFVPTFWTARVAPRKLKRPWPAGLDLRHAPKLVHELAAKVLWLEQEPLVVDDRIMTALETSICKTWYRQQKPRLSDQFDQPFGYAMPDYPDVAFRLCLA
jgi:hypothetical protein